jgi:hypothetical protein
MSDWDNELKDSDIADAALERLGSLGTPIEMGRECV